MTVPKIPADGFMIFTGVGGFALAVQQADFGSALKPGANEIPLVMVEEIRFTPLVAKQLAQLLAHQVGAYEDQFGEIKGPPQPVPGKAN